eukprot:m.269364 g.269364  ORF g.269364 m.269364 type:complete len:83 (-) comp26832_c1_seq3:753-1001(-)
MYQMIVSVLLATTVALVSASPPPGTPIGGTPTGVDDPASWPAYPHDSCHAATQGGHILNLVNVTRAECHRLSSVPWAGGSAT